jgi:ribosomal RNA methyltransferase Nop2
LNAVEFEGSSSSDDEGEDGPAYEAMERKAKKIGLKKKQMRAESALEEQEQVERAREDGRDAKAHGFEFPTADILVKEKELGVDMAYIKSRFEETLRILSNFTDARDGVHTRKEYVHLLINDLAFFYGYNTFLISKFLSIFSPAECAEFIQANEANRPLTIRVNTLKT